MKAKIHIDIGQFEFIEVELEGDELITLTEGGKTIKEHFKGVYRDYHKMGDKIQLEERPKKQSRKELPVDGHEAL